MKAHQAIAASASLALIVGCALDNAKYIFPGMDTSPIDSGYVRAKDIRRAVLIQPDGWRQRAIDPQTAAKVALLYAKPKAAKHEDVPIASIGVMGPHPIMPRASLYYHMDTELDFGFDIITEELFEYRGQIWRIPKARGTQAYKLLGITE